MAREYRFCPDLEECETGMTTRNYGTTNIGGSSNGLDITTYKTSLEPTSLGVPRNATLGELEVTTPISRYLKMQFYNYGYNID